MAIEASFKLICLLGFHNEHNCDGFGNKDFRLVTPPPKTDTQKAK